MSSTALLYLKQAQSFVAQHCPDLSISEGCDQGKILENNRITNRVAGLFAFRQDPMFESERQQDESLFGKKHTSWCKKKCTYEHTSIGTFGLTGYLIGSGRSKRAKLAFPLFSESLAPEQLIARLTGPKTESIGREARNQALFNGEPEFVNILDSFKRPSSKFHGHKFVMLTEYCDKGTLETYLREKKGNLPHNELSQIVMLFFDLISGIQKMNAKGLIHRDFKPGNIFIKTSQDRLHAKISDFGFSTFNNRPSDRAGTPFYMTPQNGFLYAFEFLLHGEPKLVTEYRIKYNKAAKIQGNIDSKIDVWSFALIIYDFLTGSSLYEHISLDKSKSLLEGHYDFMKLCDGITQADIDNRLHQEYPEKIKNDLQMVIKKILILDPAKRPEVEAIYNLFYETFNLPKIVEEPPHPLSDNFPGII